MKINSMISFRRILITAGIVYLFWKYVRKWFHLFAFELPRRSKLLRKLPGPKAGEKEHFILGHIGGELFIEKGEKFDIAKHQKKVIRKFHELANHPEYHKHGYYRLYILNSRIPISSATSAVLVFGGDLVRKMLSAKMQPSLKKGRAYEVSWPLIGQGVLSTDGHKWMRQRPLIARGMKEEILEPGLPLVIKTANELIAKISEFKQGESMDVLEEMLKLTMDVIGRVAFGWDFGSVTAKTTADAPLYDAFNIILFRLSERAANPLLRAFSFLPIRSNISLDANIAKLEYQVEKIIEAGNKRYDASQVTNEGKTSNLLQELIAAERNGDLTAKELRDNIKTLLFAGHDTTGAALSWALYLLTKHENCKERLVKEIHSMWGENGDPTYDGLEDMEYLNAVVLEVLRLYPSAGFTKTCVEDVEVEDGMIIPKGTQLLFFPYISQRDSEVFQDRPEEFVPERWLASENGKEAQHFGSEIRSNSTIANRSTSLQSLLGRYSLKRPYYPFSLGPRNCVGRPLALMEIRTVLIKLLQSFDFQFPSDPDPEFSEVPVVTLTLNPCGIKLVPVKRRSKMSLDKTYL